MWQGVQHIMNIRGQNHTAVDTSIALAEELNTFFTCFEAQIAQPAARSSQPQPVFSSHSLTVQEQDVKRMLSRVIPRKASELNRVLVKVLRACANKLSLVFSTIFNLTLTQAVIPACLKSATIIPIHKIGVDGCTNM